MRKLLAFLLAALVGGVLCFVLVREFARNGPATIESPPPVQRARPETGAAARPARELAPESRPSEPAGDSTRPSGPTSLSGTILVLDEHGGEHAGEDGILALGFGNAGARTHREIEVRGGRWTLPLVSDGAGGRRASLALRNCVLGQRVAIPAQGQAAELAIPSEGEVELRMRWPAAPLLHVRARDTGDEVGEVILYELPLTHRGSALDALHPGPDAKAVGRAVGPSPVRIEAGESAWPGTTRVLFAKSPGYAWGRIEIDPGMGEEQTLLLDPAGILELAVVGEPQLTSLEVILLAAEPPHAEVLGLQRRDARSFLLEDLRAGRYIAQARSYGLPAGTLEVEVAAGERVSVVLEVGEPPAAKVPFEGVLVVPEEYGGHDFMLELLLRGQFDDGSLTRGSFEIRSSEMTQESGSPERFRWSAPSAPVARYRVFLSLPSFPFATELDTGPTGTRDARIEVPPPCRVSLRCVDEQSGTEVWSEKISFAALTPRAFLVSTLASRVGDSSPSREFQVPQGQVLIFTTPGLYEPAARLVEVGPGTNEILLWMRKKV